MSTSETPTNEIEEVARKLFDESQKSQVMNPYCPRCKEVYTKNKINHTVRTKDELIDSYMRRDTALCDLAEELEKELTATKARNDELESALDEKNSQLSDYDYCREKIDKLEADLDAWKKMAGDIMDQLDSWSNLHPNHVTSGDVEVKAAYEKLLKEDA